MVLFNEVALAGLCISFAIKVWRFRGVFGGSEVRFGLLYGARIEFFALKRANTMRAKDAVGTW
jgi:hypothetical protein